MQNKIKIKGSLGRGVHYFKKLYKVDGTPSSTYKVETEYDYNIIDYTHLIGTTKQIINSIRLAGGPILTVKDFREEIGGNIIEIIQVPNYGLVICFDNDN
jgi:hypothetical protein